MEYLNYKKFGVLAIAGFVMTATSGSVAAKETEDARSLDAFSRIVVKGAADINVEIGKNTECGGESP